MNIYIVQINYNYEGFRIDSVYCSESDAEERAEQLRNNSRLPFADANHEFAGDGVEVSCYEAIL